MLPIPQIIWHESSARAARPVRVPEPQGIWNGLPAAARLEYWMLRAMRRTRH